MAIDFPNISPVAFSVGPLDIRWYGLAYVVSIILGGYIAMLINAKRRIVDITQKEFDSLLTYLILGIIIGGRVGYTLFYTHLSLKSLIDVFKVWLGGMSFHGGLLGVIFAIYIYSKKYKKNFLCITDLISTVAPIGLFFGRIANFVNGELYGRVTNVKWAMIFPFSDGELRHPSQLYEALTEGVLLFLIMLFCATQEKWKKSSGCLSGIFLIFYSLFRIFVEFFREPDDLIGFYFKHITQGQMLSVPMLITGIFLCYRQSHK